MERKDYLCNMKRKIRYISLLLLAVLTVGMLCGCDKLSDDDDAVVELLPGTWAFSYELQSEEDTVSASATTTSYSVVTIR